MAAKLKTCIKCHKEKPLSGFPKAKNTCKRCRADYQAAYRAGEVGLAAASIDLGGRPPARLEIDAAPDPSTVTPEARTEGLRFDDRESLSAALRRELETTSRRLDAVIAFSERRLEAARKTGRANEIDKAAKGMAKAVSDKADFDVAIMAKLELLDDLRKDKQAAKPVAFIVCPANRGPVIVEPMEPLVISEE